MNLQAYSGELKAQAEYQLLSKCLVRHKENSGEIKVFHCLEMSHPLADGYQRVRCYPFESHKFHKCNPLDAVFIIPMTHSPSLFQLPRDRDLVQYVKVLLLFKIEIPGKLGRLRKIDCAFVKYFEKYLVKGEFFN